MLNDQWVSVPTGSEDGTGFKSSRKNQYEELLFKCEDDRFELDLVIENNLSTIRQLEALFEQFKGVKPTATQAPDVELKLRDEDIDALAVRSLKRVYGDRGEDILKLLFARPVHAIPVILTRLKQKHIEWSSTRREWNKLWRQISKKHYSKALDYQSVNFKAEEKKNLSGKNLLADLKRKAGVGIPITMNQTNLLDPDALGAAHATMQFASNDFASHHQYLLSTLPAVIGTDSISSPDCLTPTEQSNAAGAGYVMGLTEADVNLGVEAFSAPFSTLWADARRLVACLVENVFPKTDKTKFDFIFDEFFGQLLNFAKVKPAFETSTPVALGSEHFFLVAKYLHVLLQRLAQGRELAARPPPLKTKPQPELEAQAQFEAAKKAKEDASAGTLEPKKDPDSMDVTPVVASSASTDAADATEPAAPAPASDAMDVDSPSSMEMASAMPKSAPLTVATIRARYDGFLTTVQNLISNALDQSALEEEIRDSLGVDSFPLFTTERVVQLVGKHLVQILSDESLLQIATNYSSELGRGSAAFSDSTYISNVRQALGQERRAYRLLYQSADAVLNVCEVTLFAGQVLGGLAGSVPDGSSSNGNAAGSASGNAGGGGGGSSGSSSAGDVQSTSDAGNSGGSSNQPTQTDAMEGVTDSLDGEVGPFLRRNVSVVQSHEDERDLYMQNDLGVYVDPIASRLRYLRDSEDMLVRRGRSASTRINRSSSRLAAKFPNEFPSEVSPQAVFAGAQ